MLQLRKFAKIGFFLVCNIQFVYEYYRIEKHESVIVVIHPHSFESTAAALSCQFFTAFSKVRSVPAVPKLYSEIP